ncbi:MAG TPA: hypothetical protein VGC16_05085 [Rhizomicrobium sp.]
MGRDWLVRLKPLPLALIVLIALMAVALCRAAFAPGGQGVAALAVSAAFLLVACGIANSLFARAWRAPDNVASIAVTALILAFILPPVQSASAPTLLIPLAAAVWAAGSKYILVSGRRHVFNPAAFGAAAALVICGHGANWWVGADHVLLPLVVLGGAIIVVKLRSADIVLAFLAGHLGMIAATVSPAHLMLFLTDTLLRSPMLFFAFLMLTDPRTMPLGRGWRLGFGALVGLLCAPSFHLGPLRLAPETALLAGNLLALASKIWRRRQVRRARLSDLTTAAGPGSDAGGPASVHPAR